MMDKQFPQKAGKPAIVMLIKHFSLEKYLAVSTKTKNTYVR